MNDRLSPKRIAPLVASTVVALVIGAASGYQAFAQRGQAPTPPAGQRGQGPAAGQRGQGPAATGVNAPVDLTGYWVSVVTEDWRYRMVTPAKGDYQSLPLNGEGRRVANMWDPSQDGACDAYGAAAIMRMPTRLHITWQDDTTLKIDTDAGQQTRLLHFGAPKPPPGEPSRQGYSAAEWGRPAPPGGGGFGGVGGGLAGPGGAGGGRGPGWVPLNVVTTRLLPGWLRRNGVPYSENTVLTEHFMRFSDDGDTRFTVQTVVDDPKYLNQTFITSSDFKQEPDGSKFKPVPCKGN